MTISNSEQKDLRDLQKFPPLGLLKYSADPIVQRRVGQVLSKASMQLHIKQGAALGRTGRHEARPLIGDLARPGHRSLAS